MTIEHQLSAFDPHALNSLKNLARQDGKSPETLRAASKQFEAVFLQMVLKAMRDATPQDSLLGSEHTKLYQGLLDQQLAFNMAQGKGVGLADVIYRQLGGVVETPVGQTEAGLPLQRGGVSGGFDISTAVVRSAAVPMWTGGDQDAAPEALDEVTALVARHEAAALRAERLAVQLDDAIRGAREVSGAVSGRAQAFVDQIWPYAVAASRKTGIPPHFMVAQAALETGWGEKILQHGNGRSSHNIFNIKAGSQWSGTTVEVAANEYVNGQMQQELSRFRSYGSYAAAFEDYATLLANSSRYARVLGQTDPADFARSLQQAGYATDPMYADKLTRIIGGSTLRKALAAN